MTTPTPEQFLALPADPDEGEEPGPQVPEPWSYPMESIAHSLARLVDKVEQHDEDERATDRLEKDYAELEDAYHKLEDQLDEVLELVKKSTSKLANSIRDVLEPEPAEGQPCPVHGWEHRFKTCEQVTAEQSAAPAEAPAVPAHDADVWEWRSYAIRLGHDNVEVGRMNRSQIRTMLGIPHGDETGEGASS